MRKHLLATLIASSLLGAGTVSAAVITPVNRDPAGQGLNDPTALAPVGGNPGTTIGQQRQIAYRFAADLWGAVLQSPVEVRVGASFAALTCDASSGVLGSAGAWYVNRDFNGAPAAGVWYHAALANALAGVNLNEGADYVSPDDQEIGSQFNANLGTPGCLESSGWYYGLDGKTPAGKINFLDVVMHEIGHGLGFQGFLNKTTGALYDADGTGTAEVPRSDVYTDLAYDNVENKRFGNPAMTNALRATAMKTPGRLVWDGASVKAAAPAALSPAVLLNFTGALTAGYEFGTAAFGPEANSTSFSGNVQLLNDATGTDPNDGCETTPAGSLTGKIAFINRGTCAFEIKVVNAQNAGAIGAVIGNVAGSAPGLVSMADDTTVTATIPAVQIVFEDATKVKAAIAQGVNVGIGTLAGRLAGADAANRVRLYAPTVVAGGSTFSHYDTSLTPNALQEPSINQDLDSNFRLDLSPSLYQDLGWGLNQGFGLIKTASGQTCNSGVAVLSTPGLIPGANLQAASVLCRTTTTNSAGFKACMAPFVSNLTAVGLLPGRASARLTNCIK